MKYDIIKWCRSGWWRSKRNSTMMSSDEEHQEYCRQHWFARWKFHCHSPLLKTQFVLNWSLLLWWKSVFASRISTIASSPLLPVRRTYCSTSMHDAQHHSSRPVSSVVRSDTWWRPKITVFLWPPHAFFQLAQRVMSIPGFLLGVANNVIT